MYFEIFYQRVLTWNIILAGVTNNLPIQIMQCQGFGQNVATQFRRRTVALSAVVIKQPQKIEVADGGKSIHWEEKR